MAPLVKQFAEETWVWGAGAMSAATLARSCTSQVTELYERDYISAWDDAAQRPRDRAVLDRPAIHRRARHPGRTDLAAARPAEDRRRQHVARGGADAGGRRRRAAVGQTRITEGAKDLLNRRRRRSPASSGVAAGHGDHRSTSSRFIGCMAGSAGADRRDVSSRFGKIQQQLGHARPAGRRHQSAEGAADPALLEPAAGAAAGRGDAAAAGQHAGRPDRAARRRQRQLGCDATSSRSCTRQRSSPSAARGSQDRYPFGDGERRAAGRLRRGLRLRRLCRQVLHRAARQAGRHARSARGPGVPTRWQPSPRDAGAVRAGASGSARCSSRRVARRRSSSSCVKLSKLDAGATRLYVDIDGQRVRRSSPARRRRTGDVAGSEQGRRRRRDVRGSSAARPTSAYRSRARGPGSG